MQRTPETLAAIGRALYGPSWRKPLSADLSVDPRTMRRWENDDFDIPDGIWPELAAICWDHADKLDQIAVKLDPTIAAK